MPTPRDADPEPQVWSMRCYDPCGVNEDACQLPPYWIKAPPTESELAAQTSAPTPATSRRR
jgi:hypothetical protein